MKTNGFGEDGLNTGILMTFSVFDDDWLFNISGSITSNYYGWNSNVSWKHWGVGYGKAFYNQENVKGNNWGKQTVGTFSLLARGDVSFRLANDMFGEKNHDRWRTTAAELTIGNLCLGTYVITNNGSEASNKIDSRKPTVNIADPILGNNPYKGKTGGAWRDGKVYSAPFWIGVKTNSQIYRFGYSSPYIQSLTQNAVHKYLVKTPFFLDYTDFRSGAFSYAGINSPISIM